MSIQILRGPASTTDNPILEEGQLYLVNDTTPNKLKVGDGQTSLNSLPYIGAEFASDIYQDTGIYPPDNPLAFSLGSNSRYADFTYTKTLNVGDSTGTIGIDINLTADGGQYKDEKYGLKMGNSDICQVNGIWMYRACNSNSGNGLYFYYRTGDDATTTYWDRMYVNSGHVYIQPNISKTQDTSSVSRTTVLDSVNYRQYALPIDGGTVNGYVTATGFITSNNINCNGLAVGNIVTIDSSRNFNGNTINCSYITNRGSVSFANTSTSTSFINSVSSSSTEVYNTILGRSSRQKVYLNSLGGELTLGASNTTQVVSSKPLVVNASITSAATVIVDSTSYPHYRSAASPVTIGMDTSNQLCIQGGQIRPGGDGNQNLGTSNHRWATIYAVTGSINTSDRNEKKDIENLDAEYSKNIIMGLKPVSYRFKQNDSNRIHNGFIAQDIEETLQSLGIESSDFAAFCKWQKTKSENGVDDEPIEGEYGYGLRYEELIAPLVKVVQQQQQEIEKLKEKLK